MLFLITRPDIFNCDVIQPLQRDPQSKERQGQRPSDNTLGTADSVRADELLMSFVVLPSVA